MPNVDKMNETNYNDVLMKSMRIRSKTSGE